MNMIANAFCGMFIQDAVPFRPLEKLVRLFRAKRVNTSAGNLPRVMSDIVTLTARLH